MLNIDPVGIKPYIMNIKEGGDRHTIGLFLRVFEVLIHDLRIANDASDDKAYLQGAINEFLKLYNTLRDKPERKKEE